MLAKKRNTVGVSEYYIDIERDNVDVTFNPYKKEI